MSLMIPFFDGFIQHLQNDNDGLLKETMSHYAHYTIRFNQDFYVTKINNPKIQHYISEILKQMDIQEPQSLRFLNASLTVSEFLEELQLLKPQNKTLQLVSDLIKEQARARRNIFLWGGLLAILGTSLPLAFLTQGLNLLNVALTMVAYIPTIGAAYTLGLVGYSFYEFQLDKETNFKDRLYENSLFLASKSLQVTAYSLLIAGLLTASPLIGVLFVLAEMVIVQKEVVALWRLNQTQRHIVKNKEMSTHELTRLELDYQKKKNEIFIELGTALAFVLIVGVMSFATGGLLLPVASFLALGAVVAMRNIAISRNDGFFKERLQGAFLEIESNMSVGPEHTVAHTTLAQLVEEEAFDHRYEDQFEIEPHETEGLVSRPQKKATTYGVANFSSLMIFNSKQTSCDPKPEEELDPVNGHTKSRS